MKRILYFVIIDCVALLFSCTPKSKPDNDIGQGESRSVSSPYDTLKVMEVPLKIDWEKWDQEIKSYTQKNGPIGSSGLFENPVARVLNRQKYEAVLFLTPDETASPAFVTIDRGGNPIDTLFLLGDNNSNDPNWLTVERSEIQDDQVIVLTDSVYHWDLDESGDRIPQTKKVSIERKKFRVLESGKIEKIPVD